MCEEGGVSGGDHPWVYRDAYNIGVGSQDLQVPSRRGRSAAAVRRTMMRSCCRQATRPGTWRAAWPLESSLVAWYARRPAIVCTAALSWRTVRGYAREVRRNCTRSLAQLAGDTQNVDINSWCEHAGGAGKLLQLPQVCILPSAHSPTAAGRPRHHWEPHADEVGGFVYDLESSTVLAASSPLLANSWGGL